MSSISEVGSPDTSAQPSQPRTWGDIATLLAAVMARDDFRRGDLADLRRMDPDAPDAAVFWRLMAEHSLLGNSETESKWGLILHGMALMTNTAKSRSAHSGSMPVGRALYLGGEDSRTSAFYSQTRLNRLLIARGPMLRTLLARMFRMMGSDRPFDWREMARLILRDGHYEEGAENIRRNIARAYYEAERRSTQLESQ